MSILERFLTYVQVETTSDGSASEFPSTPGQIELLKQLRDELLELGASDVQLIDNGFTIGTIPATANAPADTPTLAFFAHVDTSPDYSGKNVAPIVHEDYDGSKIVLPKDPNQIIDPDEIAALKGKVGETIITASGDTLLGADDKSGVAIIMTLTADLLQSTDIEHGEIKVCFTPDEEIGRGIRNLDLDLLAADFGYTVDGQSVGQLQYESFSADLAVIKITGVSAHPGTAKRDGMVNAAHLAGKLMAALPREGISPETTEGRDGFIHPIGIQGMAAEAEIQLILRDFELDGLKEKGEILEKLCSELQAAHPAAKITCEITEQYRNMRYWLENDMRPVEHAKAAMEQLGINPIMNPIRGGTDGSILTEMGLPTPNIFCGSQCIHGPLEWVSLEDMEKAVSVLKELIKIWADQ